MRTLTNVFFILVLIGVFHISYGQMNINGNIYIGNEWIDYNKTYYKLKVAKDGIYAINADLLLSAGIDINTVRSSQLQLWHNGKEVPIFISSDDLLKNTKTIEFFGQKNRIALDSFIYSDWNKKLLNKEFSLITDTAAYFLTIAPLNVNTKKINLVLPNYEESLPPKEEYYFHKKKLVYNNTYYAPTFDGGNKFRYSNFYATEGYSYGITDQTNVNIDIDEIYKELEVPAKLNIREGVNDSYNRQAISFNDENIFSTVYDADHSVFDTTFILSNVDLKNTNTLKIQNTGINDRHLLASVELIYPRKTNFDNKGYYELTLRHNAEYIELDGITNDALDLYAYSITRNELIKTGIKNGKRVILLNNASHSEIIIYDRLSVNKFNNIEQVKFDVQKNIEDVNYIILTSKKLLAQEDDESYLNEYINYRKEKDGPTRNIKVVYAEDIYNEYGYGIHNHIYAFKNFSHYLRNNAKKLKFVFIVGKGAEYWDIRNSEILNTPITYFVPTYGDYPSDEIMFSEADSSSSKYAIGRLPLNNIRQLRTYLNKVKLFEQEENNPYGIESQFWRKSILHLSGGDVNIQQTILSFLKQMEYTINTSLIGSNVTTTSKLTTEPIDGTISEKILKAIRNGVYLLTFFGHSSPGSWDISIEDPSKWDNHGKNPIVISLGCYSGNIHTKNFNVGESYVMLEDEGAIAFIASSGSAELFTQAFYGNDFYYYFGTEYYGSTLGEVLSLVKEKYKYAKERRIYTLNQQLTLLGDPGLRLFANDAPDFTPEYSSVRLEPENVSSGDKTFDLIFDTYNLGKNIKDSMNVRVVFENIDRNIADTFIYRIPCPSNKTNNRYTVPNKGVNSLGKNRLSVYLDYDNHIIERPSDKAENNNELVNDNGIKGYEFFILDNTAFPVYPQEFAIVNKKPVLRVSTSNAFAEEAEYIIQVDTTEYFNSPLLFSKKIKSKGGTFSVDTQIDYKPEVVYYWRVSPDSTNAEIGYLWYKSSFIYIPQSSEGWNQSHYFQYKRNPDYFIYVDDDRKFKFSSRIRTIEIVNGKYVQGYIGYKVNYENPAASIRPWAFMNGGIGIAVLDTLVSTHLSNPGGGKYGSIVTSDNGTSRCFAFYTNTPEDRKKVVDFINNNIPSGYYASFFTCYNDLNVDLHFDEWEADTLIYGNSINKALRLQGATLIDELKNHEVVPYNFMFRKNREILAEAIGQGPEDIINTKYEYTYSGTEGNQITLPLGPAKNWYNFKWDSEPLSTKDTIWFSIIGVDENQYETVLIEKATEKNVDLSFIDANKFPNLKINYFAKDLDLRTVPTLKYLRLIADMLPDGSINQNLAFTFPDSVQQGEPLNFQIGIENISEVDMDSLLLKYSYTSLDNKVFNKFERIAPLKKENQIKYASTINTRDLKGNYVFNFEINPNDDQPESIKYNNIGIKNFKVYPDLINPLMDVTFDGIKILNNDLVSPTPLIRIEVKDENKYLLLENQEDVQVTIEYPNLKKKTFTSADPEFKFIKATSGSNNKAIVELSPVFEDGEYILSVQSRDITGNFSGTNKYDVNFKVVSKKAITNVLNYPNPFSTATKFIFTITGEVPKNVRIQIMTLSGKVVKEITEEELGPLKIGTNITDYTWNGTDDFGNKLANGVYLYKTSFSTSDGEKYESIPEKNIDNLFYKGFGKLVIMR